MLTDKQRMIYAEMADFLIPDAEGMPSASQAEVPTKWIDQALHFRPDLEVGLLRAIEAGTDADPAAAIEDLNANDMEAFDALGVITSGAYFLNPIVKELIGYPGQVPMPGTDDVDSYIEMLSDVVDRGPVYRPTIH